MDIKVVFHHRSYYARTRNIGLGGMFIDLNHVLIPRNTEVEIVVLKKDSKQQAVIFDTRVAYATPKGYGLEFTHFQVRDFRRLQEILYESPYEVVRIAESRV